MLKVYSCIASEHDVRIVAFAAIICLLSMLTTLALARHIRDLGLTRRRRWLSLIGYVTGVGIWATHFIAMLAYQPSLPTGYSLVGTTLSVIVAIGMGVAGWTLAFTERKHAASEAALTITAGISAMHFIGMSALQIQGTIRYDLVLVGFSMLVGGLLVAIAFHWRRERSPRISIVQAAALTAAICVIHFGSMAAATVLPDGNVKLPSPFVSRHVLTWGVGSAVLVLLGLAVFAAFLDARFRRTVAEVSRALSHDPLTDVLNASAFDRAGAKMLMDNREGRGHFALVRINLDRFREINNDHGRKIADSVLGELARRLEAHCDSGIVGRSMGDEFTVLLRSDQSDDAIDRVLRGIDRIFSEPVEAGGVSLKLTPRIGVARYPAHATDWDELRQKAGFALYHAKYSDRRTHLQYDGSMEQRAAARHELEAGLHRALADDQFSLQYQPIACVQTNGVVGFEALLRWNHPTLGAVSPAEFVPVAEAAGLMVDIGNWVLGQACQDAARWPQPLKVAVNLSAVQFSDPNLVGKIKAALSASGLDAGRLELEITEGVLIEDAASAVALLKEIKALGARIAMDDFGTGFSSLSYFRQFPFDKVKIDQSFVRDMIDNRQSMAIVKAVIGLSRALDLIVLAEGVETAEQFDVLSLEGCHQVQGYFFGKPAPVDEVVTWTKRPNRLSHACTNRCEECLERLRPPCEMPGSLVSPLMITRSHSRAA